MELPADPKNLVYGIYNRTGDDLTAPTTEANIEEDYYKHALGDEEDYSASGPFDMVDYNFN